MKKVALEFNKKNSKHERYANKICLKFFNLNFKTKPKPNCIFHFALTFPSDSKILRFLSDVNEQLKYNF